METATRACAVRLVDSPDLEASFLLPKETVKMRGNLRWRIRDAEIKRDVKGRLR